MRMSIGRRRFAGWAFEVDDAADDALARRLLAAKYQGWVPGAQLAVRLKLANGRGITSPP